MAEEKHCGICRYDGLMTGICYFPFPQDGSTRPSTSRTVTIPLDEMPNQANDGVNCVQFIRHNKRAPEQED
jgi:hypothetical protein